MADNWTPDQLAYDGSSQPQLRELTPRERDILCRLINEELRRPDPLPPELEASPLLLVWLGGKDYEIELLREMFTVLDPRRG